MYYKVCKLKNTFTPAATPLARSPVENMFIILIYYSSRVSTLLYLVK